MRQLQQGDILIQEIPQLPDGVQLVKPKNGKLVIAEGELSGHSHTIIAEKQKVNLYSFTRDGVPELYLQVQSPVIIEHQEHREQTIPTGIYKIGQVLEYDYFAETARQVRD